MTHHDGTDHDHHDLDDATRGRADAVNPGPDADAHVDADLAEEARQREVAETINPGPKE